MDAITIEHNPAPVKLEVMGVYDWPVWTKEVSTFPWTYDANETCYLLEGEVTVTPEGGAPVRIATGDLVRFPQGMRCTWQVHKPVRKHYNFA
jgi:uncharacterized cupin superfamily protein